MNSRVAELLFVGFLFWGSGVPRWSGSLLWSVLVIVVGTCWVFIVSVVVTEGVFWFMLLVICLTSLMRVLNLSVIFLVGCGNG